MKNFLKVSMSKAWCLALCLTLCASVLAGCGGQANGEKTGAESSNQDEVTEEPVNEVVEEAEVENDVDDAEEPAAATDVRVTALKGPTAMGMVKLMDDSEEATVNGNNYDFTIAAAIDEVTPKLVQGETDIAAVPANLASVLYNNTEGQVQVLAINTLGVIYIVGSDDTIQSAEDLKGRTIYASGKGATPEYALNYILSANNIDAQSDVTIEWKSEHAECVAALAASSNSNDVAMLPQPFATTAQVKNENIKIVLDLTEEWDKLQAGADTPSALITGVIVARTDFVKENPEAVNAFMESYKESVNYVNANISDAATLIEKFDIISAAIAEKALPYCNIAFIEGTEMKDKLSGYINVLMEQNPKSVGGEIPADDFYYSR